MNKLIAMTFGILMSTTAHANDLTTTDLVSVVAASQHNSLIFDRDYKGKNIVVVGQLKGVTQTIYGSYNLDVINSYGEVNCFTDDKAVLSQVIDYPPRTIVVISGPISTTLFGNLLLGDGCTLHKK